MTISNEDMDVLIAFITKRTGIIPRASHRDGIRNFLSKKLDGMGGISFSSYYSMLGTDQKLFMELINESTVNETYFFREEKQFAFIKDKVLPQWLAKFGWQPINIWSAACSYGEEAYSMALLAKSCRVRAHITASDINTAVLSHCAAGIFNASSMRGGDGVAFQSLLLPYRAPNAKIAFDEEIRSCITTRQINLAEIDSPSQDSMLPKRQNIVFLRNVFIYFSQELRARILKTIAEKCLCEGGYLFVSMSEIAQIDASIMPPQLEKVVEGNVFYFHKKMGV